MEERERQRRESVSSHVTLASLSYAHWVESSLSEQTDLLLLHLSPSLFFLSSSLRCRWPI